MRMRKESEVIGSDWAKPIAKGLVIWQAPFLMYNSFHSRPDTVDVAVHFPSHHIAEHPLLEPSDLLLMLGIKFIGRIKQAKILIDTFLLDKSMAKVPLDIRVLKLVREYTKAAKGRLAIAILALKRIKIRLIQDHAFEIIPTLIHQNFYPTVQNIAW